MTALSSEIAAVLGFWFRDVKPSQWFTTDTAVDAACLDRFGVLHERLASQVPADWLATAEGCLAAVVVLDQFPRNMYRNDARAFASDAAALVIAMEAIDKGFDEHLAPAERTFLYMPFQHCEDPEVQARSVDLFARLGDPNALEFAQRHKDIIDRFGRFPHRNDTLSRRSTDEERAFLETPNSSF